MHKLKVFFDYACPYCLKGYEYLVELLPDYPEIEVEWRPCEAHPRPDRYGPHSDLCIRGMFWARDNGVDLWDYHDRLYAAALKDRIDIENVDELCKTLDGFLDADALCGALRSGAYQEELDNSNRHAFVESGVWAVPSYRMDEKKLDSVENIGVSKEGLKAFLDGINK